MVIAMTWAIRGHRAFVCDNSRPYDIRQSWMAEEQTENDQRGCAREIRAHNHNIDKDKNHSLHLRLSCGVNSTSQGGGHTLSNFQSALQPKHASSRSSFRYQRMFVCRSFTSTIDHDNNHTKTEKHIQYNRRVCNWNVDPSFSTKLILSTWGMRAFQHRATHDVSEIVYFSWHLKLTIRKFRHLSTHCATLLWSRGGSFEELPTNPK